MLMLRAGPGVVSDVFAPVFINLDVLQQGAMFDLEAMRARGERIQDLAAAISIVEGGLGSGVVKVESELAGQWTELAQLKALSLSHTGLDVKGARLVRVRVSTVGSAGQQVKVELMGSECC